MESPYSTLARRHRNNSSYIPQEGKARVHVEWPYLVREVLALQALAMTIAAAGVRPL